jgi:hypothetical protein
MGIYIVWDHTYRSCLHAAQRRKAELAKHAWMELEEGDETEDGDGKTQTEQLQKKDDNESGQQATADRRRAALAASARIGVQAADFSLLLGL